jgi:hypothetical protein
MTEDAAARLEKTGNPALMRSPSCGPRRTMVRHATSGRKPDNGPKSVMFVQEHDRRRL